MTKRSDVLRKCRDLGYPTNMLCGILGTSRSTLVRYLDVYCEGRPEAIPKKISGLADLVLKEGTSSADVEDYLGSIPLIDIRFNDTKKLLPSCLFKHVALYDIKNRALTNKVILPDTSTYLSINMENVLLESRLKSYEYSMEAAFTRFGALGIPPLDTYRLKFPNERLERLYYEYFYLLYLSAFVRSSRLGSSELEGVREVLDMIDYDLECIEYIFKDIRTPDDDSEIDQLVSEVNRESFDVSLKKRWYVVVVMASGPKGQSLDEAIFMANCYRAVSLDDAYNAARDQYAVGYEGFTSHDVSIFGPFNDVDGADEACNYLRMEWRMFKEDEKPTVDQALSWLEVQKKKKSLKWSEV